MATENTHNFDLQKFYEQKQEAGEVKVYTYAESQEIYNKINEGMPEFKQQIGYTPPEPPFNR